MVAFWTEVVQRAPHHSRSSWMKFWRRHKDQLDPDNGSEPLPGPPSKKLRYSRQDDVLLSRFFYYAQDGSSDQVFQRFARMHPHHPWKGWQEHYRLHKLEIDELVAQFRAGGMIDDENAGHGQ
ncbi:hypothetical protein FISHEDRAFT_53751 [Fistulina hepatica ATCC 64428]|uniref:Uncharacterized protein n=1 Tax=Fistulina hepatica ATCC 64428 TaxID=1128425 RepID=A0A0D7A2V1_9AGAR|nr:hypothetical protein FISHEDRAFT_53751 [Fistulina hepatica ATCC 64428]